LGRTFAKEHAMALWALVPGWLVGTVNVLLIIIAIFLILLVLVQRGRGGGLAGAFGGAGGQSAFGSKAGDAFTRFTIYVAAVWVLLLMVEIKLVQGSVQQFQPKEPRVESLPTQPKGENK
jgi:preprotein translocase subunit SecG